MKTEVINLDPFNFKMHLNSKFEIVLEFYGKRSNARKEWNRTSVVITFNWFWLRSFNSNFKNITTQAQARIDDSGFNGKGE